MQLETYLFVDGSWNKELNSDLNSKNTLVIVFASSNIQFIKKPLSDLLSIYNTSTLIGASTSGEIYNDEVYDDSLVVSVLKFEHTKFKSIYKPLLSTEDSFDDGVYLAKELLDDDLKGMFVLSDGLQVNGSKLTDGISSVVPLDIPVTGGLAGDGDRFEKTWVIVDNKPQSSYVSAVGVYGKSINIIHASKGGWDRLGLERIVTKSKDNILYELDNQPALDIYKRYLGDKASELPASGLLFPLELKTDIDSTESKVRTILAVNEEEKSITFAGDLPEGSHVTLMKANYNRLIDGAYGAAESLDFSHYKGGDILCIAISCVGRKLVLKSRVEEELEAILEVVPRKTQQIGFYSYGEISPLASGKCDLHNQTMTLSVIWES